MELALYHPYGGYYTSPDRVGADGDYFTSPAAHPAFGALIAVQLRRMWEVLDSPSKFTVVEMGAGSGLLARDILDYAGRMPGSFAQALRYVALDRYAVAGGPASAGVERIVAAGVPIRNVVGCFISNELVDSFPVHRFQVHEGTLREVFVTLDESGALVEAPAEPSTPRLAERLDLLATSLPEGFQGEVSLGIRPWMEEVSLALARGFVLTVDYGYHAEELYSPERSAGTVQTYYRHAQGGGPYVRIGRQDITAHVDFSLVESEGAAAGLRSLAVVPQSAFLRRLGFDAMRRRLRAMDFGQRDRDANAMAMLELVKPGGLGSFKVLAQERGTGVTHFEQLTPDGGWANEVDVPLLGEDHIALMEGRYPHLAWEPESLWPAK